LRITMRIALSSDTLLERVGLKLNKVPVPVGRAFFGMPAARGAGVAQRLGVFRALSGGAKTAAQLAGELELREASLTMLLDLLTGDGLLERKDGRYALAKDGRRWLDPSSPTYVGTFLEHSLDFWDWWGELERAVRDGGVSLQDHTVPADDPSWPVYIRGQYELARLSADDVAKAIKLSNPRSLLDVAGGHGWFAAALCRRYPGLQATVVDLPGSVNVGREIMRETGTTSVTFREGDMLTGDLGGPHDVALAFSILHHLQPEDRTRLLRRIRAALEPGATIAILDMFRPDGEEPRVASAATFALFFHLTSGADVLSERELAAHLQTAGFSAPKRTDVRSIPDYRLYTAIAR
jgi:ubiquinone/menaquinone biosynthesis C-methylase UbiE